MRLTWEQLTKAAYAALAKKGLDGIYRQRLDFELAEIDKQGARNQWLTIIGDGLCYDSNPNHLLLPWLFGRVPDDPVATLQAAGEPVVTSCKYQHIMAMLRERGKLPPGIVRDPDNPDIDIDCLPEARDEIKAYAARKYSAGIDDGYGAVCNVSTWMTYLFRSAILDVAKATQALLDAGETGWCTKSEALALTRVLPDEVDELKDGGFSTCKGKFRTPDGGEVDCKMVHKEAVCPRPGCGSSDTEGPTIGKLLAEIPALAAFYERYPKVIDMAVRLVGRIRAMGKHAGALIIANQPLYGNLPMYRRASSDKQSLKESDVQWISLWTEGRNTQLSRFGFTKWDILGLKNLRYIYECCKMIEENHGISFGANMEGWNDIDPDDDDAELRASCIDSADKPGRAGYYYDAAGAKVKICLNDARALGLANDLRTDAVFQFDTDLAKRILGNQVRHFFDLMILSAMGHPGPMQCVGSQSKVLTDHGAITVSDLCPAVHALAYLNDRGTVSYTNDYVLMATGRKRVVRLHLDDGRTIDLTADHRVLTSAGYKAAGELTSDDEVICYDG